MPVCVICFNYPLLKLLHAAFLTSLSLSLPSHVWASVGHPSSHLMKLRREKVNVGSNTSVRSVVNKLLRMLTYSSRLKRTFKKRKKRESRRVADCMLFLTLQTFFWRVCERGQSSEAVKGVQVSLHLWRCQWFLPFSRRKLSDSPLPHSSF